MITRGYATLAFSIFSGVSPFVSPNKKREVPMRKINVKQLTAVKPIVKNEKNNFISGLTVQIRKRITLKSLPTLKQRLLTFSATNKRNSL